MNEYGELLKLKATVLSLRILCKYVRACIRSYVYVYVAYYAWIFTCKEAASLEKCIGMHRIDRCLLLQDKRRELYRDVERALVLSHGYLEFELFGRTAFSLCDLVSHACIQWVWV